MPAPKGNSFWKIRTKHGRDKEFTTAQALWKASCTYFDWCDKNPLKEEKVFSTGYRTSVKLRRAYTIKGLCFHLNISERTWNDYQKREDFLRVTEQIEQVIYAQKYEGAAAGQFNANIIARDLGLVDKKDMTTDGESLNKGYYEMLKQRKTKKA
jgi:hypothetical protein